MQTLKSIVEKYNQIQTTNDLTTQLSKDLFTTLLQYASQLEQENKQLKKEKENAGKSSSAIQNSDGHG